jgi:hypothetical protein
MTDEPVFADLLAALTERTGTVWNEILSRSPDSRASASAGCGVGNLAEPVAGFGLSARVPSVVVDDAGATVRAFKRGRWRLPIPTATARRSLRCPRTSGRSSSPPCSGVGSTAVDTDDEGEPARYGLYELAHALRRPRLPGGGRPACFRVPVTVTGFSCAVT